MRITVLSLAVLALAACPRLDNDGDGWTEVAGDCNDDDASVSPDAAEVCGDGADNDCDGITDPPVVTWAPDVDGDGYGADDPDAVVEDCTAPEGHVDDTGDCDDNDARVNPGTDELCDGVDTNCDGSVDEGVDLEFWADADGDGYGDEEGGERGCEVPSDAVTNDGDCDDTDASVNPDGVETCNQVDDNCDGFRDEGTTGTWYEDADGDGYGNASTTTTGCPPDLSWVDVAGDCDDTLARLVDCDSSEDLDGDGYTEDDGDCDESRTDTNPGASDPSTDGVDQDCDGIDGIDADSDGYTDANSGGDDCNDSDSAVNPGAPELCDTTDQNCISTDECHLIGKVPPTDTWSTSFMVPLTMLSGVDGHALVLARPDTGDLWMYDTLDGVGDLESDYDTRVQGVLASGTNHLRAGDVNGDGHLDIVGDGYKDLTFVLGPFAGDGASSSTTTWTDVGSSYGITLGDFDDDGILDMARDQGTSTGAVLLHGPLLDRTDLSSPETTIIRGNGTWYQTDLTSLDFDGDGVDDLAVVAHGSVILGPIPTGTVALVDHVSLPHSGDVANPVSRTVEVADLDNDGIDDLLLGSGGFSGATVWNGSEAISLFSWNRSFPEGTAAGSTLAAGDLDGDGKTDIVLGDWRGALPVFYGPISGNPSPSNPDGLVFVEVDEETEGASVLIGHLDDSGRESLLAMGAGGTKKTVTWWRTSP